MIPDIGGVRQVTSAVPGGIASKRLYSSDKEAAATVDGKGENRAHSISLSAWETDAITHVIRFFDALIPNQRHCWVHKRIGNG